MKPWERAAKTGTTQRPWEQYSDDRQDLAWSDVPGEALSNIPSSAGQFASDIVQPIMHPIETVKNIGNLALGTAQKLIPGEQESEKYADAVGQFFMDRYGGMENLKHTLATDPVGFAADISGVLTGGGSLAARGSGMVGRAGQAVQRAGQAIDPIRATARLGTPAAGVIGGLTGTGETSVARTARSGFEAERARFGGRGRTPVGADDIEGGRVFREGMRDEINPFQIRDEARGAASSIRRERGNAYTERMAELGRREETVDFGAVMDAYDHALESHRSRSGRLPAKVEAVRQEVRELLDTYGARGHQLHPLDLDTLKRDLWDLQAPRMVERSSDYDFINDVRQGVAQRIEQAAPEYAEIMRDYSEMSDLIREIEGTLSINPRARVDTQLRKLLGAMRNNVNTNYSTRLQLLELLAENGATHLMDRLAGITMGAWAPRGIARVGIPAAGAVAAGTFNPLALALPVAQSPRLWGEGIHAAGRAAGAGAGLFDRSLGRMGMTPPGVGQGLFQVGRLGGINPQEDQ